MRKSAWTTCRNGWTPIDALYMSVITGTTVGLSRRFMSWIKPDESSRLCRSFVALGTQEQLARLRNIAHIS